MITWSGAPAPLHLPIPKNGDVLVAQQKNNQEKETIQMKKINEI
jgi:hypothetical protein